MSEPTPRRRGDRGVAPTAEELNGLLERVRRLPEARIEKVQAVRDALRNNAYENEQILSETIERLSEDFETGWR